jgi:hypothetical protein
LHSTVSISRIHVKLNKSKAEYFDAHKCKPAMRDNEKTRQASGVSDSC